jgi:hypothetical protein
MIVPNERLMIDTVKCSTITARLYEHNNGMLVHTQKHHFVCAPYPMHVEEHRIVEGPNLQPRICVSIRLLGHVKMEQ